MKFAYLGLLVSLVSIPLHAESCVPGCAPRLCGVCQGGIPMDVLAEAGPTIACQSMPGETPAMVVVKVQRYADQIVIHLGNTEIQTTAHALEDNVGRCTTYAKYQLPQLLLSVSYGNGAPGTNCSPDVAGASGVLSITDATGASQKIDLSCAVN